MSNSLLSQMFDLLPENPKDADIEKAYKTLAQYFHPDRNPKKMEWATEKMKELNYAKECLMDPERRAAFIQNLRNKRARETTQGQTVERLKNENQSLRLAMQQNSHATGALVLLLLLGAVMSYD